MSFCSGTTFYCVFCTCYTIGFLVSIFTFIFWLIFLPQELDFKVTESILTQFDFNPTNNTLNYNLAINITIRNSNKRVGVHYKRVQVIGIYGKKRFARVYLAPFYQGHKNTSMLHAVLRGQEVVPFGHKELPKYNKEKGVGIYGIRVNLAFKIKPRYGKYKLAGTYKPPQIECNLKVPLTSNSTSTNGTLVAGAGGFRATWCQNVYFFSDPNDD